MVLNKRCWFRSSPRVDPIKIQFTNTIFTKRPEKLSVNIRATFGFKIVCHKLQISEMFRAIFQSATSPEVTNLILSVFLVPIFIISPIAATAASITPTKTTQIQSKVSNSSGWRKEGKFFFPLLNRLIQCTFCRKAVNWFACILYHPWKNRATKIAGSRKYCWATMYEGIPTFEE